MTKFLIPAAILASTLAAAAPAAAQWVPQGNAYGYNNFGQGRRLEVRVMQLRRQIQQLDRSGILSNREAAYLDAQARNLEFRVRQSSYNGVDPRERFVIERQIQQLEQRIQYEARDGNRRPGYGNGYGYNNGYGRDRDHDGIDDRFDNRIDRDRDGRDDRYEDDQGRHHDRRGDRDD